MVLVALRGVGWTRTSLPATWAPTCYNLPPQSSWLSRGPPLQGPMQVHYPLQSRSGLQVLSSLLHGPFKTHTSTPSSVPLALYHLIRNQSYHSKAIVPSAHTHTHTHNQGHLTYSRWTWLQSINNSPSFMSLASISPPQGLCDSTRLFVPLQWLAGMFNSQTPVRSKATDVQ